MSVSQSITIITTMSGPLAHMYHKIHISKTEPSLPVKPIVVLINHIAFITISSDLWLLLLQRFYDSVASESSGKLGKSCRFNHTAFKSSINHLKIKCFNIYYIYNLKSMTEDVQFQWQK